MMVYLEQAETCNPLEWLDIVWSLVLLNLATENHVSSVLKDEFVESVGKNQYVSPLLILFKLPFKPFQI